MKIIKKHPNKNLIFYLGILEGMSIMFYPVVIFNFISIKQLLLGLSIVTIGVIMITLLAYSELKKHSEVSNEITQK